MPQKIQPGVLPAAGDLEEDEDADARRCSDGGRCLQVHLEGDPSLRLKSGYAQDDASGGGDTTLQELPERQWNAIGRKWSGG